MYKKYGLVYNMEHNQSFKLTDPIQKINTKNAFFLRKLSYIKKNELFFIQFYKCCLFFLFKSKYSISSDETKQCQDTTKNKIHDNYKAFHAKMVSNL